MPEPGALHARGALPGAEQPAGAMQETPGEAIHSPGALLIQIIEGEIIPRLFMAHRSIAPLPAEACGELADCAFMAEQFLHNDSAGIVASLQTLLDRGIPHEQVCLELLAPVPRTLSLFWAEGRCSFDALAQGLSCLDQVLREMHAREYSDLR